MTMTQLSRYQRELRREISTTATKGTADYKRLKAELNDVNRELRSQRAELNGTKGFWADMGRQLKQFGILAISALGATAFFTQIQSMIEGSARLSDALADVQKTTGLTGYEIDTLNKRLKAFNTRTPRAELLGLAEIAGRLGITGVKDIEGFVRAADKINVALGDALGDPETVMRELGKLTETFNVKNVYGIEDSLLKVGSAINELGMASTANEGYMVEFTKRLGGIAPLAGISIENVLGLGATLDSLGQTAEVSTTALSKLFIDMAKNAEQYAKFARMEVADFVELMNTDANEAFLRMLEGVKDNSEGITELAATLGDLGQDGGRVVGVLGTLANNVEKVREQQEISNVAFEKGTSVVDEFNIKNENMAANLAKVQKWLAGLFVNSTIMSGMDRMISRFADWIAVPVSETLEAERIELMKLHTQIITTNEDSEKRVELIRELKKQYPDYLGQIDADTVSNEQLTMAIRAANDQLINKIILQEKDEEIMEQSNDVARKKIQAMESEDKIRQQMVKLAERHNLTIQEGISLEEAATKLANEAGTRSSVWELLNPGSSESRQLLDDLATYRAQMESLTSLEGENNALLTARNDLIERLGLNMEKASPTVPGTDPEDPADVDKDDPDPTGVPGDPEAAKKKLDQMADQWESYQQKIRDLTRQYELAGMEDQQRELAQVWDRYAILEEELVQHLTNKTITEEEFVEKAKQLEELRAAELANIRSKWKEKEKEARAAAEQQITEATLEEKELAKLKVNQHYDELLALARKFGLDSVGIEEARRRELKDLQTKYDQQEVNQSREIAEAKVMIAQSLGQALGGVIDFVGNKSGELTTFQKLLVGAQIAADTAASLGRIVPLAAEASAGTGPAAPFVFAGYIAAMGATVLGAIGKAKQALSESNVPEWNSSSGEEKRAPRRVTAPVSSYYMGGDTGKGSLGYGDRYGDFAGFVHKDEYVVPSFIRSHPYVADVMPAIEAIRQEKIRGFYRGGEANKTDTRPSRSTSTPVSKADPEMLSLLKSIDSKLDRMPTRIKAYLVDSEWQEFRDLRDDLEDRYRS
ncbi:phage tail tape measure protein [Cyclobacterium jeungdonense]|uniref:Phage tail tape measure protein n=1 Tax=Cyclobacterium jeungdonense TaxID=708087 RepID=A0ABT8C9K3_9BACT|nr:phage tail tape measure protein [Cyclobacterium jeungdonense]MDN3688709.1 phage tail tape measure protein [Cyclobacterium jeungdonense]